MRGRVTTRNGAPSSLSRAVVFISREHGSAGTLVKEPSPFPPPRLACFSAELLPRESFNFQRRTGDRTKARRERRRARG